ESAKQRNPERWRRETRNWKPVSEVWLNPEKSETEEQEPESVFSNAAFNFARSFLHLVALFGWRLPCLTAHRHDF
ncbi:hypothetical protein, partial [Thiolapillus sp.]